MGVLNDVLAILSDAGVGLIGETLFGGNLPPTPDDAVCIYEYAGKRPSKSAHLRHPGLQLVVRNLDYSLGRDLIEKASVALQAIDYLVGEDGMLYLKLAAVQEPHSLGKDAGGRFVFVQNFIVTYFEEEK